MLDPIIYLSEQLNIHPLHLFIEVALFVFIFYLISQKSYKPHKDESLTEAEIDQLVAEYTPVPLVPHLDAQKLKQTDHSHVISSAPDPTLVVDGKECINLATTNFLGMSKNTEVLKVARETISKYGLGTCGPRGFYGTIDTHLDLEKRLAKFMGTEECILYSAAFATPSSLIPAFSSRGDLIFCDAGINFSLQLGVTLSRSDVKYFKHNDLKHLESILEEVRQTDIKTRRKLNRRFVVVEGLYGDHGDIAPLKELMVLKEKYKFRIILDDSYGIGVLGKTGRGTCEHLGIPPKDIEILCSSMGHALGSSGGFCVGSYQVVFHQRLNSAGYVFSASAPPYLVTGAHKALDLIDHDPSILGDLQKNIKHFRNKLDALLKQQEHILVLGDERSPIIHLRVKTPNKDRIIDEEMLHTVVEKCTANGVAVVLCKYAMQEKNPAAPSIKLSVSAPLSTSQLDTAADVVAAAIIEVFNHQTQGNKQF